MNFGTSGIFFPPFLISFWKKLNFIDLLRNVTEGKKGNKQGKSKEIWPKKEGYRNYISFTAQFTWNYRSFLFLHSQMLLKWDLTTKEKKERKIIRRKGN